MSLFCQPARERHLYRLAPRGEPRLPDGKEGTGHLLLFVLSLAERPSSSSCRRSGNAGGEQPRISFGRSVPRSGRLPRAPDHPCPGLGPSLGLSRGARVACSSRMSDSGGDMAGPRRGSAITPARRSLCRAESEPGRHARRSSTHGPRARRRPGRRWPSRTRHRSRS